MYTLFIMFCIVLALSSLAVRIGFIRPTYAPAFGALTGGALGLAYAGAALPGAAAGFLAAMLYTWVS